MVNVIIGLIQ